ncbi:PRC-barrel domain containing protein [Thiorhodococcus minor]|uniref:PRC-barrel domain containing protein n=1 Tax=Thiorhodococcus minor TaxID=57489 RepID=A0A6M0K3L0_9GAMM|nr:PRC-barrel domain containing protein [Thiorhodococcus minor]NEV64356.1 PRC-barrel domain containing protein [Thiorhodococcus minor]
MLRSLVELEGYRLVATDGEIGRCSDFLFDDEQWTLRYMVARTGPRLLGRKVLVSLAYLEQASWEEEAIPVRLTRKQIEECPPLDADAPVSRRYERAYHDFFATSYYWVGSGLWGNYGYPELMVPHEQPGEPPEETPEAETHVRSVDEVLGYKARTPEGQGAGHIADFIIEDKRWGIRYLVLDTSYLPFSKKLLLASEWITEVSWIDHDLRLDVTAEQLEKAPPYDLEAPINDQAETVLYNYYGRPRARRDRN